MYTEIKKEPNKQNNFENKKANANIIKNLIEEIAKLQNLSLDKFNLSIAKIDFEINKNAEIIKKFVDMEPVERINAAKLLNEWFKTENNILDTIDSKIGKNFYMSSKSEMDDLYVYVWIIKKMRGINENEVFKYAEKDERIADYISASKSESKENEISIAKKIFLKAKNNKNTNEDVYNSIKKIIEKDLKIDTGIYN
ncbi:MAG: hypothetical protein M1382_04110 [Candidatus Marsarchaeota archaeon]|nr:hypothetical protein [Candidatus Marsarchaeota archaeon]